MAAKLALILAFYAAHSAFAEAHPVEKVINLLEKLMQQVEAEGKQEQVTFTKFEYWCQNSEKSLEAAIAEEKSTIDVLTSQVQSKKEEEAVLSEQISALEAEILKLGTADGESAANRGSAAALYAKVNTDYSATIQAIGQAIQALESAQTNTDGFLLTQQKVRRVLALAGQDATEEQRGELAAFVQQDAPNGTNATARPLLRAEGDYGGHIKKYAFKSRSVIELLKTLKLQFEDAQVAATKAETNSINAYDLAKAARTNLLTKADASKDTKNMELGSAQGERTFAEGSLKDMQTELEADSATLAQTQKACTVKRMEWTERSETRTNELQAMKAAIGILAKATGVRTEAPGNPVPPPSPVQGPGGVSFLEVGSKPRLRAVQILRASARATHSQALERLAQEISAAGPFDQVNNMIQKMMFHLMDEQKDEDNHKNWCDLELNKTETSKGDKEDQMLELSTKLTAAKATEQTLATEAKAADEMAETIASHMAEATEIRELGKQENTKAAKDAKDAQQALSNAIAILQAFYKETGMVKKEAWELLQRGVNLPSKPATWGASYTGVADPAGQPDGIITVLEKVSADFAKMEAQTKAQEESDQKIYDEDMKLCDIEKARRVKESEMKTQERRRLAEKIASMTATKKHVSTEHEATVQYLSDLEHACVDGDSTYEDRKAARTKEIDALKEAQVVLEGAFSENSTDSTDSFLQRRRPVRSGK